MTPTTDGNSWCRHKQKHISSLNDARYTVKEVSYFQKALV